MSNPAITVLMPVYNAELYLPEAIDSILNQTFANFEFLIINDGSIDNSEEIILSYADKRIRYVKNKKNLKLIATLNKGIEIALGKYIARMDADDISLPDRLQTQFDFMEQHTTIALCGSWFELMGDKTGIAKYAESHSEIMMKMLYQCHFCHPSIIMRKSMIDSFEIKFDPTFIHAEDYDFFVRIGEKFKLANIQKALIKYRIHEQSVSVKNKEIQYENSLIIKKKLFEKIGLPVNKDDIEFFKTIMQREYSSTELYINRAQLFLEKLIEASKQSVYFENKFFENYLAQLWFNVTYNCSSLGLFSFNKFFNSSLAKYKSLSIVEKIKFFVKAFLKK